MRLQKLDMRATKLPAYLIDHITNGLADNCMLLRETGKTKIT